MSLRAAQRSMIGDLSRSVALCGLGTVPLSAAGDGLGRIALHHAEARASFAGVTFCASPWACPVCAPRLALLRAEALRPQVARLMAGGWTAHLLTLTLRHTRDEFLPALFDIAQQAWKMLKEGGKWTREVVKKGGKPEFVRGYDITWSEANGWHLHLHVSLYLPPGHGEGDTTAAWVLRRWMECVMAAGGEAEPQAQDARRVDNPAAAAAYAVTPAACYEAVALAMKRARSGRGGLTPFELLERAVAKDRRFRAVWRQYVAGTKGRKQVTTSHGLKLSGDEALVAEDKAHEADLGPDHLVALTRRALRDADRAGLLPVLLDVAEAHAGDPDAARVAVAALLAAIPDGEWWILPPLKISRDAVEATFAASFEGGAMG
jgi:hypothetical protein